MNIVSFFTGAGGLDIGLQQAGFQVKLAVELEAKYCKTLKMNHPTLNVVQGDIMEYSRGKIYEDAMINSGEEIDLMVGGSPCQSFSTAGNRLAFASPGGEAMLKFANLVEEVQPKAFLLENVKGLLSAPLKNRPLNQRGSDFPPLNDNEKRGSALNHLLNHFPGYKITYKLLNAADYGVPQKRERVFFIGIREDIEVDFEFPDTTHNETGTNGKKKWVTVKDVFNKMDIKEHHYVQYSQERLHFMKMIPKGGGNWRDLPKGIVEKAMGGAFHSGGGKVGYYRRVKFDQPSPTLLTSPAQKSTNLGHPFEDRPLSIEEYLAIQEFPSNYKVCGTLVDQYTQIGNAVPIRLAFVLGKSLMNQILLVKA